MAKGNMAMWQPSNSTTFHGIPASKAAKKLTPQGQKDLDEEARQSSLEDPKPEQPQPRLNPPKNPPQSQKARIQSAQERYQSLAGTQAGAKSNTGILLLLGAIIAGGAYILSQENKKGEEGGV